MMMIMGACAFDHLFCVYGLTSLIRVHVNDIAVR